ncbi:MAG: hypothetical protein ABJB69_05805 [Spartobacteria bacterium]
MFLSGWPGLTAENVFETLSDFVESRLSALGQDLNFLFRMERLAATQRVPSLISYEAQSQMGTLWKGQPAGAFALKGFEGEYQFFSW